MAEGALLVSNAHLAVLWCAFYGFGIIAMLVLYGLLQERIMSQPYSGDYFTASVFLVLCNRLVAITFAFTMIRIKGERFKPAAPMWKYLAISLSNVAATTCQYDALRYVAFPVQMLGKSFKMIPVMLWGMLISRKHYSLMDWLIAASVTGGVTQFLLTGTITSVHSAGSSAYGLTLLVAFLALDGFTCTFQEKLFKEYGTSKYNQMLYINLGSATVALASLLASGTLGSAMTFCATHPTLAWDAFFLSGTAVAGQWFIYSQVKEFGALVFAATMNLRQVVSILLSYAAYGHSITGLQVMGLCLVFGGIGCKAFAAFTAGGKQGAQERAALLRQRARMRSDGQLGHRFARGQAAPAGNYGAQKV